MIDKHFYSKEVSTLSTASRTILDFWNSCHAAKTTQVPRERAMTVNANGVTFPSCTSTIIRPVPRRTHPRFGKFGRNEPTTPYRERSVERLTRSSSCSGRWLSIHSLMFAILIGFLALSQPVAASQDGTWLEGRTALLFDRREAPEPWFRFETRHESSDMARGVAARQIDHDGSAPSQQTLPHPFDTSLGNNFTAPSCPSFFKRFLASTEFNACLPFSLLLQTSTGFFSTTRSPSRLSSTLDATCNVNYQQCSTLMDSLASEIQLSSNCGNDFQMQNPLVLQAYNGFTAYQPLYHAGCLTDPHGNYCFATAIDNVTSPASSYIYYLPLGVPLPGGTMPTCNTCLSQTMSIFATYASNSTQPLSHDYSSAAQQVDSACGSDYVEQKVTPSTGSASTLPPIGGLLGILPLLVLGFFFS